MTLTFETRQRKSQKMTFRFLKFNYMAVGKSARQSLTWETLHWEAGADTRVWRGEGLSEQKGPRVTGDSETNRAIERKRINSFGDEG